MRARTLAVPLCLATAALAAGSGCEDDDGSIVARLVSRGGAVHADEGGGAWKRAEEGRTFRVGHAVKTGADSQARVALVPAGGLRLGERSQVRFGRGERKVALEVGEAEIEAGDEGFVVHTDVGEAQIEGASRVKVSVRGGELRFEVLVGRATIEKRGAEPVTLTEGETTAPPEPAAPADAGAPAPPDAGPPPVRATVSGHGARARPPGGSWRSLTPGDADLSPGADVEVGRGTEVELVRGDARAGIRGEATFTVGGPGGPLAEAARGSGVISTGERDAVLKVPGGAIVVRGRPGGSRADVSIGPGGDADVVVRRGAATARGAKGAASLAAGDRATVAGGGEVQRPRALAPPPRVADLSIRAGESPVIHVADPPAAVRVRFSGDCGGEGAVEIAEKRSFDDLEMVSRGDGSGIVRAPRGVRYYRVTCDGDGERIAARGRLRVRRDRGSAKLPERPPHTIVEADGRRYTVLYQNLLPRLTFRWPRPPADDLALHIERAGGRGSARERVVAAARGTRTLSSGALEEGTYRWWFQSQKVPAIRSPRTELVVRFDNAAATAHVREPEVGERWNRSRVRVSGVTLEGWKVSVGGERLETDDERRFSETVSVPRGDRALAIRFSHRSRGVHYYLRRSGGR